MKGIYKIENLITHTIYIGKSENIKTRWQNHRYCLNRNKHYNPYLQRAWNKYGEDNFKFEIIEICSSNILNEREIYWINYYGGIKSNHTYNVTPGGLGGAGDEEWRKKISDKVKKHYLDGDYDIRSKGKMVWIKKDDSQKKIYKEQLDNYLNRGWIRGRKPIPLGLRYKYRRTSGTFKGKHHTEESKQKMRINHCISSEVRLKMSQFSKERFKQLKWVNNGYINKRVKNIEEYINQGWRVGRIPLPQISSSLKKYYKENPDKRYWGANSRRKNNDI